MLTLAAPPTLVTAHPASAPADPPGARRLELGGVAGAGVGLVAFLATWHLLGFRF